MDGLGRERILDSREMVMIWARGTREWNVDIEQTASGNGNMQEFTTTKAPIAADGVGLGKQQQGREI